MTREHRADRLSVSETRWIGHRVTRNEDAALLRGRARFVDDIDLPGVLHAVFLRSNVAHGKIKSIGVDAARALTGIHAVLLYQDLRPLLTTDRIPLGMPSGSLKQMIDPFVLARDEVCYVGEPIAVVIADSRQLAEDAVSLIEIEIDHIPAVTNPTAGLEPQSPRTRSDCPDNLVAASVVEYGDVEKAFEQAVHRFSASFRLNKGGGHSMEPRGVIAQLDDSDRTLKIWSSTQRPHHIRAVLVASLGMSEHEISVKAPDVGGGFGPKAVFHPEELAIPAAALLLGRPIKWIEDRLESFTATTQEHIQDWDVEIAFDDHGKLLGFRGNVRHDHGACTPYGVQLPYNSATNLLGPYVLPAYRLGMKLCLTNKVPATPTRGAGRPQGTFVMEIMLDRAARALGIGRDEIRRRNMIGPHQMPYQIPLVMRDGTTMTYDSGDYPKCQQMALEAVAWDGFEKRRKEAATRGKLLGLGLANYVEGTGRGPFENVGIRIGPSGKVVVCTGATAQGQGTKTMLAQVIGEVLSIDPAKIHVVDGDTRATSLGHGAFASRQTVTAGSSAYKAAILVREKAKRVAADLLEASTDDLELVDGMVRIAGAPGSGKSLGELARVLEGQPGYALPSGIEPGLGADVNFQPETITHCNGTHAVEIEIDPDLWTIKFIRYVVVHDCGRIINPMMVDGQIIGAVANGIGATLLEWMRFDEDGQPMTVTYADYLLPSADTVPRVELYHLESPSPLNPLGAKGAGEGGTIGAPAAIISAVEDALSALGVRVRELPITPSVLFALSSDKELVA